ncbi:SHOCT domain-containing protein [Halorubrum lacusprofundi]|jgi:hypothetical protein|uniref:SHOCT domain-containing protein n=1 Tax=Halorubrum lacusprofundi (strain ATCC 49239 / DSM 5036 / JCM 8891 / ACAM 34) TaxID=416348 RepID=B9LSC6_HALLT|nr:hypothetical protein [Halorubrum lacusprofundi]ACM55971.1 conserved hypothetical protein [Halorubrum lacusprofundi ATCC 49239]MCG1006838.1 hypothetical protein [Halorubrum lacusprofundi]
MDGKRTLYYAAIAIAVLIALSVVGTIISLAIGVTVWMVTWAIRLAVLAGLVYVAYKAGSWLLGDDNAPSIDSLERSRGSTSASAGDTSESRQDRLRRQYVEGQISEAEFERRIASELETEEFDDIDRELERER